ncbi:peroxisomal membrane protein PEX14-like [Liolophura sinensis]|uniref:peroxisomal membrane protein PEX14-like n=1 Tax=Liolophura sinensis TaxID=3198878 RepID=UPI00315967EE
MENGDKNQVGDVSSITMADQDDPRENLIATAVNFLQNPNVQSSSLPQKRHFENHKKSVMTQVLEVQAEMSSTLVKVQETLQAIQTTLRQQEEQIQELSIQSGAKKTEASLSRLQDSQLVTELKSEVTSIKGLLLNRRQFPPAPTTTPVLPSWQRSAASPAVTSGNVGPSGDSEAVEGKSHEAVSDVPNSTGERMSSEPGDSGLRTHSGLITASKNNGMKQESHFNVEEEESDELDPANQILAEQSSVQQEDSQPSPSRELRKENGILVEDDSTLKVLS